MSLFLYIVKEHISCVVHELKPAPCLGQREPEGGGGQAVKYVRNYVINKKTRMLIPRNLYPLQGSY